MSRTNVFQRLRTILQHRAQEGRRFESMPTATAVNNSEEDVDRIMPKSKREETSAGRLKCVDNIPGPPGLPYIGTMLHYRLGTPGEEDLKTILTQRYHKYGGLVQEKVAGRTCVHVFDPEHVRCVYLQEGKWPLIEPLVETTQIYREMANHSPGLGNTNGEEWYRLRRGIHRIMMRPREVAAYLPFVDQVARAFVQHLDDVRDDQDHVPDFAMEVAKWNLESAAMTAFDESKDFMTSNSQKAERWIEAQSAIMHEAGRLRYTLPLYRYMPTPKWTSLVQAEEYLTRECQQMVEEAMNRLRSAEERQDLQDNQFRFLRALLSSAKLKDSDFVTLILSLMTDGLPSTVPTLLSVLYCLATNPHQQERLHQEVARLACTDVPLTQEVIGQMTYLKACVKETLRLFPVTLEISRVCPKDIVVGDYLLQKGTRLKLNNFVAHRDPTYFPEPNVFRPERWLRHARKEEQGPMWEEPESGRDSKQPIIGQDRDGTSYDHHPYSFIPFGHGPRMCPGRRFAEQDLYVVITRLVQRFCMQWHGQAMGQRFETLMQPDCPIQLTFYPRF